MAEIYKATEFLRKNFRIQKIFEMIREKAKVIVIFGSYAKGLETKESDLDILIINGKIDVEIAKNRKSLWNKNFADSSF